MRKLKCDYLKKVSAFADHELLLAESSTMETHLRTCALCKSELEQVMVLKNDLKLLAPPDIPIPVMRRLNIEGSLQTARLLKQFFALRVSLPLPLAVLLVTLFLIPTFILLTRSRRTVQVVSSTPVRVEVPVERVVVKTVETPKPKKAKRPKSIDGISGTLDPTVATTLSNDPLRGFHPPESANMRVVRDLEH